MKYKKLIFFLLVCVQIASSQIYNFKYYNEDAGLPQLYIYNIAQDAKGYIYLATGDGLAIYDSKKIKVINKNLGLAENFISTQFFDKSGTLWIGHFQKGVSYIAKNKTHILKNNLLCNVRITCFAEDNEHNIYVGTLGKGIFVINKKLQVRQLQNLDSDNITCLYIDTKNKLLAGSSDGLSCYKISKNIAQLFSIDSLDDVKITSIKLDRYGNLLLSTFGKGLVLLEKNGNEFVYKKSISVDSTTNNISDFIIVGNEVWAATFGNGVVKYKFKSTDYSQFDYQHFDSNSGLTNQYIQSIFADDESNIWMGSYGGGLFQLVDEKFVFYNASCGIANQDIYSVAVDIDKTIWIGSQNGLQHYSPLNKKSIHFYDTKNGFVNDIVSALFFDNDGGLWIGTSSNGLFFKSKYSNKIENLNKTYQLKFKSISSITANASNNIFVGTTEGLIVINPKQKTKKIFTTTQGLTHNLISNVFVDNQSRVWFACHGSGPFYYQNGEFTVFKDIDGLRTFNLNSVAQDKNNNIWLGSEGDGVFMFDGKKFVNYRVEQGLISNYCYSVVVDDNNIVWVTSKDGVSYLSKSANKFAAYNKSDGFLSEENNMNATFKDATGNIWFGTENGLMCYNSNTELIHSKLTNTIIENVVINDKIYSPEKTIELSYNKYQIKFNVVGVCFSNASKVKYRYILEGYENKWNEIESGKENIVFLKIDDGNYTFKIQSTNQYGIWNSNFTTLKLNIAKPFWKTSWFIILVLCTLIVLVQLYSNYKTKALLKKQKELEISVQEKTVEIRLQNVQLEAQKHKLEITNNEITDSITYAKRIQEAILPSKMPDVNAMNQVFIYFSPRDIVSGDFYWYYPYSETELLIAAADCTGHGVPGAFLTMMGTTLLNKIIKDYDITTPSEILLKLDENVRESLHQNTAEATKDGMDVAICKIDSVAKTLSYSGACRPLMFIRNQQLVEYRPAFFSIGYYNDGMEKVFENYVIDTQPGDMAYIFSDGYADQFGGEKKQKFMSKKLKELLIEISPLPIPQQQAKIEEAFIAWKGDLQQTDDILVMGIRIT